MAARRALQAIIQKQYGQAVIPKLEVPGTVCPRTGEPLVENYHFLFNENEKERYDEYVWRTRAVIFGHYRHTDSTQQGARRLYRKNFVGTKFRDYYKPGSYNKLEKGDLQFEDEQEEWRQEKLAANKLRGKTAPKKGEGKRRK